MSPDQYCQEKAVRSGSSFYYSFLFLPPEKRRAITALYAFCREVDDAVDECSSEQLARTKLAWWRSEIEATFSGQPRHPVGQALLPVVRRLDLDERQFHEIVDGMQMDLDQHRFPDFATLQLYCHRVAGVVGQLSACIFGFSDARTLNYAHDLGLAFQLTNIIRDVGEDARRDRIYLPLDELDGFGVSADDIFRNKRSENFVRLMLHQTQRAKSYYQQALVALPAADRKNQRAGLAMAAIYRALLNEIEREGFNVLEQKTSLTPLRKLWLAWKAWVLTSNPA
jgi:15-cis-phytoene synthase